jgi:hypothetical protein
MTAEPKWFDSRTELLISIYKHHHHRSYDNNRLRQLQNLKQDCIRRAMA